MRILYDCFSCSPYYGSDEGLGWMWPYKMSKYHEVWVLIRKDRKEGIDRYCKENNIRGIHFVYCDLPDSMNIYYKRKAKNKNGTFDFLLYQYLWQYVAVPVAKKLHKKYRFDIVHHAVTNDFRIIGRLDSLGIPFILGPIGGAQETPPSLMYYVRNHKKVEKVRSLLNRMLTSTPGYRRTIRAASDVFVSNEETMEYILPIVKDEGKCRLLTELAIDDISVAPEKVCKNDQDDTVFIWAGRVEYRKGLELLMDVFRTLKDTSGWKLKICGTGSDLDHIKDLAADYEIDDRIEFPGFVEHSDLQAMFADADAFVFPSLRETTGSVLLESMSVGLPVISLNQGGARQMIRSDEGYLIDFNSKEECIAEFSRVLKECIGNHEKLYQMGQRARARALEDYSWTSKCEYMNAVYEKAVAEFNAD